AICSASGIACLISLGLAELSIRHPTVSRFTLVGAGYCLALVLIVPWIALIERPYPAANDDPLFSGAPSDLPIVMTDAAAYSPTWWYSRIEDRSRIYYLSDLKEALKHP